MIFWSKIGRGLHERKGHPNWADQENLKSKQRLGVKNRWTEEKRRVMCRKEAELTIAGQTANLNKDLPNFTGRMVEAVMGQRSKNSAYRALVTEYFLMKA